MSENIEEYNNLADNKNIQEFINLKEKMLTIIKNPIFIIIITDEDIDLLFNICTKSDIERLKTICDFVNKNSIAHNSKIMLELQSICIRNFKTLQAYIAQLDDKKINHK